MIKTSLRFVLPLICMALVCSTNAQSNTNIWQGTVNTDWATVGNWSKNATPTVTDSVLIPLATNYPVINTSGTFSVKTIYIDSGAMLTVMGFIGTANGIINKGDISGSGNIKGDVISKAGSSISPGGKNAIGILSIGGSWIDTLGSKINFEIAGEAGSGLVNGNDQLNIFTPSITHYDTAFVTFINGYYVTETKLFTFIVASDTSFYKHFGQAIISGPPLFKFPVGFDGYFAPITLTTTQTIYSIHIYNVLPLQLLNFTAQQQNAHIAIQWQTANEVNTSHFTIQRSVDAVNFIKVADINAKGGGNYSYNDNLTTLTHELSPIYYRLQMVDKDGAFTYSEVFSCKMLAVNKQLLVFPNPVKDCLLVQLPSSKSEKWTLQIANMQGKILQQQIIKVAGGAHTISINTFGLAKGSYTLLLKGENLLQTKQFVKE
ncbi:MAG: T9SS type A sorting domain-containing protein [Flavobacterium sp.]|nr:T9SS type A sorting domain-containing protein [Flavobacterium sp.]